MESGMGDFAIRSFALVSRPISSITNPPSVENSQAGLRRPKRRWR